MGRWSSHQRLRRVEQAYLRLKVGVCTALLGSPTGTRARAEFRRADGTVQGEIGLTVGEGLVREAATRVVICR